MLLLLLLFIYFFSFLFVSVCFSCNARRCRCLDLFDAIILNWFSARPFIQIEREHSVCAFFVCVFFVSFFLDGPPPLAVTTDVLGSEYDKPLYHTYTCTEWRRRQQIGRLETKKNTEKRFLFPSFAPILCARWRITFNHNNNVFKAFC